MTTAVVDATIPFYVAGMLNLVLLVIALIPALVLKALLKKPISKPIVLMGILAVWLAAMGLLHSFGQTEKAYWLHAAAVGSYFMLSSTSSSDQ